jgi:hypothetical protein
MKNEFVFERITYSNWNVSRWTLAIFVPNRPIHVRFSNLCTSQRTMIYFRRFKSSILFQCDYWEGSWKEYILPFRAFKLEKASFFPKRPIQLSWGKTYIFPNNTITSTLFPYENWVSIWKEYLWQHLSFKVEIVSVHLKQAHSAELKMNIYLLKEYHLCMKLNQVAHCFLMRIN